MRHQKAGRKLNRTASHRNAMFRNMVTSLFQHGRIQTTDAKAKELRRWADQMVTLAKRGDLHARRQALAVIRDKAVVHKLFEEAAKRFGDRAGGYTYIVKLGKRRGDAAPISLVELVTAEEKKEKKKKKPKAAKKAVDKAKKKAEAKAKEKEEPGVTEAAEKAEDKAEPKKKKKVKAEKKEEPKEAEVAEKVEVEAAPEAEEGALSEAEEKAEEQVKEE
ncbi:MAG: 50S ribosomal protein L17, partial [Deltaproteobacteria bacterium]|nr:50S ribosomal protein L17 [Deltaproteobacteria bacterium]